jgi:hypothetical protein
MYFRRKTSAGRAYLQIVESRREGDQVRQQVIATARCGSACASVRYRQHRARRMPQHTFGGASAHRIEKTMVACRRHGDQVGLLVIRCL